MIRLPALDQIVLESQRPLLAVLDTTLVLVVRSMRAEHPELEDDACRGLGAEPPPTQRALAASIVLLANSLRARSARRLWRVPGPRPWRPERRPRRQRLLLTD